MQTPELIDLGGTIANAVLHGLLDSPFHDLRMYSEVLQDSTFELFEAGKLTVASASSITLSAALGTRVFPHLDHYKKRLILRPQEISNHPEVIRRLGVIAINTALEFDIYGNVNSTHVGGTHMMNGIGGSGDFTRNAYLSIFMCPSVAKDGRVSTIVPMCSHVDHSEHSVQIIATEQGLADLRGLSPIARARRIINRCAHPAYRDYLHQYLESAPMGHLRHDLKRCFELYINFQEHGQMLPGLDLSQFAGD